MLWVFTSDNQKMFCYMCICVCVYMPVYLDFTHTNTYTHTRTHSPIITNIHQHHAPFLPHISDYPNIRLPSICTYFSSTRFPNLDPWYDTPAGGRREVNKTCACGNIAVRSWANFMLGFCAVRGDLWTIMWPSPVSWISSLLH